MLSRQGTEFRLHGIANPHLHNDTFLLDPLVLSPRRDGLDLLRRHLSATSSNLGEVWVVTFYAKLWG
ncbi:MAG: hypothetical protein HOH43_27360 [Candidatus Latescibacteria bacterium]|nr:hypothetical protein [Candidatus Latescibacterota bacterium]